MHQFLVFIFGATASNKSEMAHSLAKDLGIVVVNGDSRQLYKDIPILSACPETSKTQEVEYALYQTLASHETPSVSWWMKEVKKLVAGGRSMVVVGGCGLYLNTLLEGISPIPRIPTAHKKSCESLERVNGKDFLVDEMTKKGARPTFLDKNRVLRAYQVFTHTGKPMEWWWSKPRMGGLLHQFPHIPRLIFCPVWNREELYRRADLRCQAMMNGGLMEEIEKVKDLPMSPTFRSSIGLSTLIDLHRGKIGVKQAMELFQKQVRNYIKRQQTWLNNKMNHKYIPIYPKSVISFTSLVQKNLSQHVR